jgi:hypothetical protein
LNQLSDRCPQAVVRVPISLAWTVDVGTSTVNPVHRS